MTGAQHQSIWVTLRRTAILWLLPSLDLAAIIITEMPNRMKTIRKSNEGVILLSTPENSFYIVGKL